MHFQRSHHYAWVASFPTFSPGGGGAGKVSLQLQWLEIKWRGFFGKKEKTWRKFFPLFPYLSFFQYVIKVNSCCLFFLISRAFLITMPFSLIWIPNMKIWRILKVIWLHAIIQINANGIVSNSRMKTKYNSCQLRIHTSSVTQNRYD